VVEPGAIYRGKGKSTMVEAVCFDLGDTLVAEETAIHNSSRLLLPMSPRVYSKSWKL